MRFRVLSICVLTALLLSQSAYSQSTAGSISGTVIDPQKAAVADANVTATEVNQQFSFNTKTDSGGRFVFAQTPPGRYSVTVESSGFKRFERTNLEINANDKIDLGNLVLTVGSVSESISVTAEVVAVQTENAERSDTLTSKQVENIAVNGRNALALAALVPGVVSTGDYKTAGTGGLGSISANGTRFNQNQLSINGVSDVDTGSNGGQNVSLSLDSVQEFKILTGVYQAEYGRSAGAQVIMVTKTGSTEFHGSGYWYHRHDSLNANTWWNNRQGLPRPLLRFNDPGYTIGGPVFVPKVFNKEKNKLFFFWSQEIQRQLRPNSAKNATVPTALERQGDFSQSVDNNGNPFPYIKDPTLTGLCNASDTSACFKDGGVLGRIPQSRLYAPGLALLKIYPQPNAPGNKGFNYTSQVSDQYPRREDLLRLDYNVTSKLRVFGHYINNDNTYTSYYGATWFLTNGTPLTPIQYANPGNSWAGGATYVLSPTMTNEFNFGTSHNSILIDATTNLLTRGTSGINLPVLFPNAVQKDYIPQVTFNGTRISNSPGFGSNSAPFVNYNTTLDWTDNFTKVWGRHTIKAGVFLQRSRKDQTSFNNNNGNYNFGDTSSNPLDTGFGFANAAVGVYQTFDQANSYINGMYRYWNIEFFAQDTFKLTPRLTLDYGVRAALYQPQYDASLQASTFVPSLYDPSKAPRLFQPATINGVRSAYDAATNTVLPASNIGLIVPNSGSVTNGIVQAGNGINKYLVNEPGPQWGPRVGIAYDVFGDQHMVIRTGGGIYYDRIQGNRVFDQVRNPPESVDPTLYYGYAQNISSSGGLLAPPTIYMVDPTGKIPTTYSYTFDIQSRLPYNFVLDTAYVGSQSRHLQDNRNLNYIPFGATFAPQNQDPTLSSATPGANSLTANFLRAYRGYADIRLYEGASNSNYNALQVALNRRYGAGLFLGVAYTWSKALTNAPTDTNYVRPDQYTRQAYYGPATFDRRHNLAINYVYNFPSVFKNNGLAHTLVDGWQLSGVTRISTGDPFTPGYSISGLGNQNITGSFTEGARLALIGNPNTGSGDPYNRLNPAAFAAPKLGSIGLEAPVYYVYNPGIHNWDVSIQKQFNIKERAHLQLRLDAFNVFNHVQFSGINSTLNFASLTNPNPTNLPFDASGNLVNRTGFGTVSGVRDPRILQTLIRFEF